MPTRSPLFVSTKVRCGGAQHTIGVNMKGKLVLCDHDLADFESLRAFLGDGEETPLLRYRPQGGEKVGGVRDIRCFYVLSQWREYHKTGRFYQIPKRLRDYLKITRQLQQTRKRDDFRFGPRWPEYELPLKRRKWELREEKWGRRRNHSPVCTPDGRVVANPSLHATRYVMSLAKPQIFGLVKTGGDCIGHCVYDPHSATKLRIVVPPYPKLTFTGERLEPIPLRPAPLKGFYNIAPHRWWDFHGETDNG